MLPQTCPDVDRNAQLLGGFPHCLTRPAGHNLGLGHAYLTSGGYEFSSVMSDTGPAPNLTGPLKCFNAADNKRLGFYESRSLIVSPQLDSLQFVTVAAFSEWAKDDADDPVLVSFGKYSMQYNLASEHNRGTEMLQNTIAVAHVDPETGTTIVNSEGLEPNGSIFTVDNFKNNQQTLQVEACLKVSGGTAVAGKMIVGFSLGHGESPCSQFTGPTPPSTPSCRNTSNLEAKFWWGNAYVVRSCEYVGTHLGNVCGRRETSDPEISRHVFDVCEQECSTWKGCQVSHTAEPVMKPPQPACPDTSNVEITVWKHGIGRLRKTCGWVTENPGYCRRRELSGDPLRFYVYQFCEQECSDWVWCE